MCSIENVLPDNMHVMPVLLSQRGSFLASSAIAISRLLPPKNLDRSKRNKLCSIDNNLADHMHAATIDLVAKNIFCTYGRAYVEHLRRRPGNWPRTVCTYGRKICTYGRVSHRVRPTRSYLFALTARNRAYCPY